MAVKHRNNTAANPRCLIILLLVLCSIGLVALQLQTRPSSPMTRGAVPLGRVAEERDALNAGREAPPECLQSPHFNLSVPVMSVDFRLDMERKINGIVKSWPSRRQWQPYETADVRECLQATPECLFFRCLGVGVADERPYRKCCVEHAKLRDTLHFVAGELEAANVSYFLSTGTALGALRHRGTIIPWDTDVDVAVFPSDRDAVERIFEAQKHRHFFNRDQLGKQMFWVHASADGKPADGPHVEIFFNADYTKHPELLLPLVRCRMYERDVWCPGQNMLGHWFGSRWDLYGGCHYHDDGRATLYVHGRRIEKKHCGLSH